jgi:hypothetical protein
MVQKLMTPHLSNIFEIYYYFAFDEKLDQEILKLVFQELKHSSVSQIQKFKSELLQNKMVIRQVLKVGNMNIVEWVFNLFNTDEEKERIQYFVYKPSDTNIFRNLMYFPHQIDKTQKSSFLLNYVGNFKTCVEIIKQQSRDENEPPNALETAATSQNLDFINFILDSWSEQETQNFLNQQLDPNNYRSIFRDQQIMGDTEMLSFFFELLKPTTFILTLIDFLVFSFSLQCVEQSKQ